MYCTILHLGSRAFRGYLPGRLDLLENHVGIYVGCVVLQVRVPLLHGVLCSLFRSIFFSFPIRTM